MVSSRVLNWGVTFPILQLDLWEKNSFMSDVIMMIDSSSAQAYEPLPTTVYGLMETFHPDYSRQKKSNSSYKLSFQVVHKRLRLQKHLPVCLSH